jgi:methylglutaconyl-CoA hydratase
MARPILVARRLAPLVARPARPRSIPRVPGAAPFRPRFSSSTSGAEPLILCRDIYAPGTGYIRVLELNRPNARNAISRALLEELRLHVEDIHAQYGPDGEEKAVDAGTGMGVGPTRALVVASRVDETFCAGADLKERRMFTPDEYVAPHVYEPCVRPPPRMIC